MAGSSFIVARVLEQFGEGRTVLLTLRKLPGPMPDLTDDATRAQVERASRQRRTPRSSACGLRVAQGRA